MLYELETAAVIYERIASDTCLFVIRFGETTVDDHEFSVGLDGIFAFSGVYRHVAVDDMPVGAFYAKGVKNVVDDLFVVA